MANAFLELQTRGAEMRKQASETRRVNKVEPAELSSHHAIPWNDRDIREFLVDSHPDFQEDFFDSPTTPSAGAVLVLLLLSRGESNLADPTRCQKNTNLSVHWKLFVQKTILDFEQGLFPLLNFKRIQR
jgi:hypothetical protein